VWTLSRSRCVASWQKLRTCSACRREGCTEAACPADPVAQNRLLIDEQQKPAVAKLPAVFQGSCSAATSSSPPSSESSSSASGSPSLSNVPAERAECTGKCAVNGAGLGSRAPTPQDRPLTIKRTVRVPPSQQPHLEHCHLLVEDAQQSRLHAKVLSLNLGGTCHCAAAAAPELRAG
jgi:hypothetical protein